MQDASHDLSDAYKIVRCGHSLRCIVFVQPIPEYIIDSGCHPILIKVILDCICPCYPKHLRYERFKALERKPLRISELERIKLRAQDIAAFVRGIETTIPRKSWNDGIEQLRFGSAVLV